MAFFQPFHSFMSSSCDPELIGDASLPACSMLLSSLPTPRQRYGVPSATSAFNRLLMPFSARSGPFGQRFPFCLGCRMIAAAPRGQGPLMPIRRSSPPVLVPRFFFSRRYAVLSILSGGDLLLSFRAATVDCAVDVLFRFFFFPVAKRPPATTLSASFLLRTIEDFQF